MLSMYRGENFHLIFVCFTSFSRYSKLDFLSSAICGMSLKNLNVVEVRDMTRAGGKIIFKFPEKKTLGL